MVRLLPRASAVALIALLLGRSDWLNWFIASLATSFWFQQSVDDQLPKIVGQGPTTSFVVATTLLVAIPTTSSFNLLWGAWAGCSFLLARVAWQLSECDAVAGQVRGAFLITSLAMLALVLISFFGSLPWPAALYRSIVQVTLGLCGSTWLIAAMLIRHQRTLAPGTT